MLVSVLISVMMPAGEALGRYVPQTVLSKDGNVLDVDLVLSEAVSDQDEVLVEYSDGPTAFRTRCARLPACSSADAAGL
jgi:hypothetical protein